MYENVICGRIGTTINLMGREWLFFVNGGKTTGYSPGRK